MRDIKKGFLDFGHGITMVVNTLLLFLVYVVGVGLSFVLSKIVGKQFLDLKRKKSYWQTIDISPKEESLYRQF